VRLIETTRSQQVVEDAYGMTDGCCPNTGQCVWNANHLQWSKRAGGWPRQGEPRKQTV